MERSLCVLLIVLALTGAASAQTYSCQLNSVLYVGGPVTCWSGSDIGAQLNSAYAALPAQGGTIYILPQTGGGCYAYTTEINFNVSGKYPILRGFNASNGAISGGACLNFTSTTGTAINLDYVPISVSNYPPQHGLRDLTIINNSCVTAGGCGSSATGITFGTTNWGASNAIFENLAILGFDFGYVNNQATNIPAVTWINPLFQANTVAFVSGVDTGNILFGGSFLANASAVQQSATLGGEYVFHGTQFADNSSPLLDFTRTTGAPATLTCFGCHFEDSPTAGTSHRFIAGVVNAKLYGGVMETDQTSGSSDYFVSVSGASFFADGVTVQSGGKTITAAFTILSPSRAFLNVSNLSPSVITLVGGGDAAFVTNLSLPGSSSNAPTAASFEAPLISQGLAQTSGNVTLSGSWGTTAAVSAVAGFTQTHQFTITASGSGQAMNPTITDTLPESLANANTVCTAQMVGGTGTLTLIQQTTLSKSAPMFTFGGTPVAGSTYVVAVRCGP